VKRIGALLSWRLRQDSERELWGEAWTDTGYVFTMENGEPVKPDYATRLFETLRKRAGLPKITLHGARHEHASLWIAGGGDVTQLSKRLGHSTSRITADLYVARVGDADRVHAERVSAMIPRASSHTPHTQPA
jgi:integrase